MEIGKLGAFCFMDAMPAPESAAFCRRVERMGYKVIWSPEAWGREPFAHGGYVLANTDSLIYATGIANVWVRDPMTMAVGGEDAGRTRARPLHPRHRREPSLAGRGSARAQVRQALQLPQRIHPADEIVRSTRRSRRKWSRRW